MYFLTGDFFAGKDGKDVLKFDRTMYSLTAFPFLPANLHLIFHRYLLFFAGKAEE